MADPTNVFALDDVAFMTSLQWSSRWWPPRCAIRQAIERLYEDQSGSVADVIVASSRRP